MSEEKELIDTYTENHENDDMLASDTAASNNTHPSPPMKVRLLGTLGRKSRKELCG